jgi:hypothetical protein
VRVRACVCVCSCKPSEASVSNWTEDIDFCCCFWALIREPSNGLTTQSNAVELRMEAILLLIIAHQAGRAAGYLTSTGICLNTS